MRERTKCFFSYYKARGKERNIFLSNYKSREEEKEIRMFF